MGEGGRRPDEGAELTTQTRLPVTRGIGLLSTVALVISAFLSGKHSAGPGCVFRRAFHIPCPGCGLTRSFAALWHGNLSASFHFHPLGLPLFALMAMGAGVWLFRNATPGMRRVAEQWENEMVQPRVWMTLLAIWLGVWVARLVWAKAGNGGYWW